ncbi:MAG: ThuA domain-containing protein [Microbacterium sp.]
MKSAIRSGIALVAAAVLGASIVGVGGVALDRGRGDDDRGDGWGRGGQPRTASQIYLDDVKDYGVCRGSDPKCYHDWGNGWVEGEAKRILIWSRTAGPRHAHLGTPLAPGLNPPLNPDNVAQAGLKAWAEERGIAVDYTEDLASFSRLNNYQAVVFLSSNRDTLDDTAQTTLMQYIRGGGGFVGIHNAFGAEYHWPYYEGLLGGANFYNHGPNRAGTVEVMNKKDVSTKFMPKTWTFTDEWYNLIPYPSYVNVLLEVDKATSQATPAGHGDSHPVSWCQYYDGGRSWLTTLGHDQAAWTAVPLEGDEFFKQHVMEGLESVMGIKPFCVA